ncbi:Protein-lysine N-methyltransferase rrg1 [Paramarasmius palmivorus]|uniref:Protein-lysine N-methyltransferase rrg1 n=1 Tax=Paramarasmius palmivorus TaxID=297713 RepID=A0AAW0D2M7_9AGAR
MPTNDHRQYKIKKDSNTEEYISVQLSAPRIHAENLYLQTWGSSFILANLLHQLSVQTTRVLELGAGTGLVGIRLVANIELNKELHGGRVKCGTLDWNSPNILQLDSKHTSSDNLLNSDDESTKPTLVLAADTMYTEDHPSLLSRTIFTWLKKSKDSRAVVCYPMRVAYLDAMREFWEILESGGMEVVSEGREEIEGDEWDDERLHEWSVWKWKLEV